MKNGQAKLDWIKAQIAANRTVYLASHTRITKLTAKHLPQVRVKNDALEIQSSKRWLDYSYTTLTAR